MNHCFFIMVILLFGVTVKHIVFVNGICTKNIRKSSLGNV